MYIITKIKFLMDLQKKFVVYLAIIIVVALLIGLIKASEYADQQQKYELAMREFERRQKQVLDASAASGDSRAIAPIGKLKGRSFQELVDLSHHLTTIMYDNTLTQDRRAEILSIMLQTDYDHMYEGVKEADDARARQCDGPCFAALKDTIIGSYTDETLDVFWYYEKRGMDSVLMFDMDAYNQFFSEGK